MKHLLGFYCDTEAYHSIYSDSNEFNDNRFGKFFAVIKPLKFQTSNSNWLTIPQHYSKHKVLDYIISNQLIFYTSNDDEDFNYEIEGYQCGVLMHFPTSDNIMSRTGVFVIRKGTSEWEPLTIQFRQQLYLLECKGVGSGLAGYKSLHIRNQAGASKNHLRVTGGMTLESVEKEMTHLIKYQSYFDFNVHGILPYGCIGFRLESSNVDAIDLGLLLRLSPSNIRFSFEDFGDFKNTLKLDDVLLKMSDINSKLYQSGFRHENMSSNNLCYFHPDRYVPTDFEELQSIYAVPTSLDVNPIDEPFYLKLYPFRYSHHEFYSSVSPKQFMNSDQIKHEIDHNFQLSQPIFSEHFFSSTDFVLDDYFDMTIDTWMTDFLRPVLLDQLALLTHFLSQDETVSFDLLVKDHMIKWFKQKSIGDYFAIDNIATLFVSTNHTSPIRLKKRVLQIQYLLRQIDYLLTNNSWFSVPSSYSFSFLKPDEISDYYDIYLILYPFLSWVAHWRLFLTYNFKGHGNVDHLIQRLGVDLQSPESIYTIFKQKSDQSFIDYITSC